MTRRRMLRREQAPDGSATFGGANWQPPTERCKATHDVPYTLRCVLGVGHDRATGRHARDVMHRDKNGGVWE